MHAASAIRRGRVEIIMRETESDACVGPGGVLQVRGPRATCSCAGVWPADKDAGKVAARQHQAPARTAALDHAARGRRDAVLVAQPCCLRLADVFAKPFFPSQRELLP